MLHHCLTSDTVQSWPNITGGGENDETRKPLERFCYGITTRVRLNTRELNILYRTFISIARGQNIEINFRCWHEQVLAYSVGRQWLFSDNSLQLRRIKYIQRNILQRVLDILKSTPSEDSNLGSFSN